MDSEGLTTWLTYATCHPQIDLAALVNQVDQQFLSESPTPIALPWNSERAGIGWLDNHVITTDKHKKRLKRSPLVRNFSLKQDHLGRLLCISAMNRSYSLCTLSSLGNGGASLGSGGCSTPGAAGAAVPERDAPGMLYAGMGALYAGGGP